MLIQKLFQVGIAGFALGGTAMAADPETVRLGRTEVNPEGAVHEALKDSEDTELVHGRHHYRGGYYGGGYYGGYYRNGFSVSYYGGGWGNRYYGGGWGYGYSSFYYPRTFYYPSYYYSYPTYYYPSPVFYYGIGGQEAPTVNLGKPAPAPPMASPQSLPAPTPAPAPEPQKVEPVETLKVNMPASRPALKYPAFGDK